MSSHRKDKPKEPTFVQKGLSGFQFPLDSKDLEIYFVDSSKGHDDFVKSPDLDHHYYVLEGTGAFEVSGTEFPVNQGQLVEVPAGNEFAYSGALKLLLIISPPFGNGSIESTRPNPAVS